MEPPDFAAASVRAAIIVAVDHQAAAQRSRDQQVEKAAVAVTGTELHFADGGCCGVIFNEHGNAEQVAKQVIYLDGGPSRIVAGLIGQVCPCNVVGKGHADADYSMARDPGALQHLSHCALEKA